MHFFLIRGNSHKMRISEKRFLESPEKRFLESPEEILRISIILFYNDKPDDQFEIF